MQRIHRYILIILALVIISGCTKYLDFEGEDAEPRLVLNGIFTPDSTFRIELSHSAGYISQQPLRTLHNGNVVVYSENGEFLDSLKHAGKGIYKGVVTAQAGKSYKIGASAPTFENIYAVDYIPEPVFVSSWNVSPSDIGLTEYSYTLDVDFVINDQRGVQNYYVLEFYGKRSYYVKYEYDPNTEDLVPDTVFFDDPGLQRLPFETSESILTSETDLAFDEGSYYASSLAFCDNLFDGKSQKFRVRLSFYMDGITDIEMVLKSCSEAYYRYKRSIENYRNADGDPFSQPVQVYTNIENGLGIWAGYSVAKTKIQ